MSEINTLPGIQLNRIRTERVMLPGWREKEVTAEVLRLDLMHGEVSGNKWFKLQYYLQDARDLQKKRIVTFGGPWSNHLLATAAMCRMEGLQSAAIVRGEEPEILSYTLQKAKQYGMELYFSSRSAYRAGTVPPAFSTADDQLVPEGGYGPQGVAGAATICDHFNGDGYSHVCCALGTGTMTAGLISGLHGNAFVTAISVLKNDAAGVARVNAQLPVPSEKFEVIGEFHFGGYAKYSRELVEFMNSLYSGTGIPTDIVYTGKLFYALDKLILRGHFPPGSKILIIHSGGLQGNSSLENGTLIW